MQENEYMSRKQSPDEIHSTILAGKAAPCRDVYKSIIGAIILLAFDLGITGSYTFSLLFCTIWFFVSVFKNLIQKPGWKIAIIRVAIPPLILLLAWTNGSFQLRIAEGNASRVIAACEQYRKDTGKYPETLNELVPGYLPSIPRAKYCLDGGFGYFNSEIGPTLYWHVGPYRKLYSFVGQRWSYLD